MSAADVRSDPERRRDLALGRPRRHARGQGEGRVRGAVETCEGCVTDVVPVEDVVATFCHECGMTLDLCCDPPLCCDCAAEDELGERGDDE